MKYYQRGKNYPSEILSGCPKLSAAILSASKKLSGEKLSDSHILSAAKLSVSQILSSELLSLIIFLDIIQHWIISKIQQDLQYRGYGGMERK